MRSLTLVLLFCFSFLSNAQQLTSFYDHEGDDFDFRAQSIYATSDSLYGVVATGGANDLGYLFKMSLEDTDPAVIYSFGEDASNPLSIVGNDTVIFGTTRDSPGGSGKLFRYSLQTYEFEFLYEFSNTEGQSLRLQMVTDSVIWGTTNESFEDKGSVFTIKPDGSDFRKVYNNTNAALGQNPTDIVLTDQHIYITFFNGGGIPYGDGTGSTVSSGSIVRVDLDGSNYLKILEGSAENGTSPQSLLVHEGKLYYLFASKGQSPGAVYGYVDLDGNANTQLGQIKGAGRGDIVLQGEIIHMITSDLLYGLHIDTEEGRTLQTFSSEIGRDAIAGPTMLGDSYIVAVQQGGPERGGGLLKWKNTPPENTGPINIVLQEGFETSNIDPSSFFVDDEGISFYSVELDDEYGSVQVVYNPASMQLDITEVSIGTVTGKVIAQDTDFATTSASFSVEVNAPVELTGSIDDQLFQSGFDQASLDILDLFTDRNGDEIVYEINLSSDGVIDLVEENGKLIINEIAAGTVTVDIGASDNKSDPASFTFQIKVNTSPEAQPIESILVNEGFGLQEIDLSGTASDPDGDDISFVAMVSDLSVITAEIENGILTVNEVGIGLASITILVEDGFGGMDEYSFDYEVNGIPFLSGDLIIVESSPGFGSQIIDLSNQFEDPDNDPLTYSAVASKENLIEATVTEDRILITEVGSGSSSVILTVSDGRGGELSLTVFDLILGSTNSSNTFNFYPNPSSSSITFENILSQEVEIYSLDGRLIKKYQVEDKKVNIEGLRSGTYLIRLSTSEGLYVQKLIKE